MSYYPTLKKVAQYVRIFFLFKSSDTFAVEVTFRVVKSATVPPLSTYLSLWIGLAADVFLDG